MTLKRYDAGRGQFVQAEYQGQMPCFRYDSGSGRWLDAYLTDGLVGYWSMEGVHTDTAAGTVQDASGQGNDGALNGGITTGVSGPVGEGFEGDGVDDYIEISGVEDFSTTNEMTVVAFCKSNTSTWNSSGYIVSRRDQFILHPNVDSKKIRYYFNTQNGYELTDYTVTDITVPHHYGMTYNAGSVRAYIDGAEVSSETMGDDLNSDTGSIKILKDEGRDRYGDAVIDEVRLYNRALSSAEINALYKQGLSP